MLCAWAWQYAAEYMTQARELLANASTDAEYLKTTQIHCSQFFPGISAEQFTTAYANSYGLATLLLDTFFNLLCMPAAIRFVSAAFEIAVSGWQVPMWSCCTRFRLDEVCLQQL